ncbi:hypothetical protein Hanom_Chr12g01156231 [Helianthus anomalus]
MPRVGLAQPRVNCLFCPLLLSFFFLHNNQSQTRPASSVHGPVRSSHLAILVVWMWIGAWQVASTPPSLYLCWFLLSFCSFCTFKLFEPFKLKRNRKISFSNISTKK